MTTKTTKTTKTAKRDIALGTIVKSINNVSLTPGLIIRMGEDEDWASAITKECTFKHNDISIKRVIDICKKTGDVVSTYTSFESPAFNSYVVFDNKEGFSVCQFSKSGSKIVKHGKAKDDSIRDKAIVAAFRAITNDAMVF